MPPRSAPGRGGAQRGGQPPRGAPRGRGATRGVAVGLQSTGVHVDTVGVPRPEYGTAGRPLAIFTNSFPTTIPESTIRHYDTIEPSTLPVRLNNCLIKKLQLEVAPEIFTPPAVYDGRKNMFAARELPLGPTNSRTFDVTLAAPNQKSGRPPKIYKIKVTKVNEINSEVLEQYVQGRWSHGNDVLTAITALNVVIRMHPNENYPFNVRSFFTDRETKDIGGGIVLWRGYFQSVRPGVGRMLINVDISTGMMYKPGSLVQLALEFFGRAGQNPNLLSPGAGGLPDRERLRLQRFLIGVRVTTTHRQSQPRVIKKLSTSGANAATFSTPNGNMTVSQYFQTTYNLALRLPGILCIEVGSGALIPFEVCNVIPGQVMRKQLPPEKTKDVVEFATKKPEDRFNSIRQGIEILSYGQSEYVRNFGMSVNTAQGPLAIQARVLNPPTLKYGQGSRQPDITPRDGAWNMIDKRLVTPSTIKQWIVVVFERQGRFNQNVATEMVRGLVSACRTVGITVNNEQPLILWKNGQGDIGKQLFEAGSECHRQTGSAPNLVVVVLPDGGNDIYTAVKHFGDVTMGVATQCLKSNKCARAKPQYWANVCLKINPKLGGVNTIPKTALSDPHNPMVVIGADVIHPAPGAEGRPSFTAVVGNVDSNISKYIATTRVQTSRQEIIDDLQDMTREILSNFMDYRRAMEKQPVLEPRQLLFFRDGVSEGQFQHVLERELPLIKAACADLKINPKITVVVVGKRHHVRFKTQNPAQADRSGNCPAGTVVDREVGHPTDFDFFLQSHGGLLGTSRPAHYSVLHDEHGYHADSLQGLAFALCHVYARATRSVSIPAPVYYADIVCSRAKNHYDPRGDLALSEIATQTQASGEVENTLAEFKKNYKPLHKNQSKLMYFT